MVASELSAFLVPSDVVGSYPFADKKYCMGNQIVCLHDHPDTPIRPTDMIIIGVESTNSVSNIIRQKLWGLSSISYSKGRIFDAGNIPASLTLAQQYQAVETLSAHLAESKAHLILIGSSQEFTSKVYAGWRQSHNFLRLAIIDSKIDLDGNHDDFHEDNFVNGLIDEPYEKLLDLSFIGIQGYFSPQHIQQKVLRRKHEFIRLGNLRGNIREAEPTLSDAHLASIDFAALRTSDAPGNKIVNPNGLYAEEICMLARYAGIGQNNKFMGLFGLSSNADAPEQTTMLAAQVIWHYIEGVSHRKVENPIKNLPYNKKYVVSTNVPNIEMVFYRNEHSGNWWFELPVLNRRKLLRGKILVRCNPSDYASASNGDIPQRWMRWYQKAQKI
jgi:arginase family enzyme